VLVFGLVAFTGVRARLPVSWLGPALVLDAVSSELVQHFWLPHRTGDVFDAVADVAGVLIGSWLAGGMSTWRRGPR
jgi:VanZ family protein